MLHFNVIFMLFSVLEGAPPVCIKDIWQAVKWVYYTQHSWYEKQMEHIIPVKAVGCMLPLLSLHCVFLSHSALCSIHQTPPQSLPLFQINPVGEFEQMKSACEVTLH